MLRTVRSASWGPEVPRLGPGVDSLLPLPSAQAHASPGWSRCRVRVLCETCNLTSIPPKTRGQLLPEIPLVLRDAVGAWWSVSALHHCVTHYPKQETLTISHVFCGPGILELLCRVLLGWEGAVWSLLRSPSTSQLGPLSSEGWTGAGGSALKTAHARGWQDSPGCSVQAAAPMAAASSRRRSLSLKRKRPCHMTKPQKSHKVMCALSYQLHWPAPFSVSEGCVRV